MKSAVVYMPYIVERAGLFLMDRVILERGEPPCKNRNRTLDPPFREGHSVMEPVPRLFFYCAYSVLYAKESPL
jgi:hypothetical protein